VEIQGSRKAEKCSAALLDRHAVKKITVSFGILWKKREREKTSERAVRKDTPGSQGSKQICTAFLALGIARFLAGSWIFETRFEIVKA